MTGAESLPNCKRSPTYSQAIKCAEFKRYQLANLCLGQICLATAACSQKIRWRHEAQVQDVPQLRIARRRRNEDLKCLAAEICDIAARILLESHVLYGQRCWQPCLMCSSKGRFGKLIPRSLDVHEARCVLHIELAGGLLHEDLTDVQRRCEEVQGTGLASTGGSARLRCLKRHANQVAQEAPEVVSWRHLRTCKKWWTCAEDWIEGDDAMNSEVTGTTTTSIRDLFRPKHRRTQVNRDTPTFTTTEQ